VGRHLQDASEDIKAHPWKLLNKPEPGDIAYENLRTTAQAYVRATALVSETSQRMEELLKRKDLPEGEAKRLMSELVTQFEGHKREYERYAKLLEDLLRRGGGPPAPPLR
jgi:hypothetical protein